ncbi:MAG: TolC family protein [Isosphaeraceae bacterium]
MQFGPGVAPPVPVTNLPTNLTPPVGAQSISLEAALYGALTSNPDLATLRLGSPTTPSAEAVEVARHFPTTLNPTLWFDLRPLVLIPPETFVSSSGGHKGPYYKEGQVYFYFSLRQPLELGHQTTHRYHIAQAAYEQQQWVVLQAELTAIVQTYRFFQTAEYRREKLKIARELAQFNDRLLQSLQRRLEANQVLPADVVMAKVEGRASRQLESAAEQDYVTALTDLRNQLGMPESAGSIEPFGDFTLPPYIPPANEQDYIQMALESRPDIHAAQALVRGTKAAEMLARGDQIPSPIVGPQYEIDEVGVQYFGFVYVTSLPIWNTGKPLVRQRQAEHYRAHLALQQAQQRAVAQVRSALAKWNGASRFVTDTQGLTNELSREVSKMEDLFDKGQVDLTKLLSARQRLIQLKSSEIDSIWAATQAQADLLLALGAPALLQRMLSRTENAVASPPAPAPASPPSQASSPFTPPAPAAVTPVLNRAR